MTSRKIAVLAFAVTSTVFACSEAPSSDVSVDVESDHVDIACMKGTYCKPPKVYTPPVVIGGDYVFEQSQPVAGPSFTCDGPGPEGGAAWYRPLPSQSGDLQCWSSEPLHLENGIPYGFTLLSLYICPNAYPVNRCDAYGRCTCWSY